MQNASLETGTKYSFYKVLCVTYNVTSTIAIHAKEHYEAHIYKNYYLVPGWGKPVQP